jgi:hypothetical protein
VSDYKGRIIRKQEYKTNVIEPQIKLLQDRGVWAKPAR